MNQHDQEHGQELAGKIVRRLNEGTDNLDRTASERLLEARKAALTHYQEQPAPAWSMAWAGNVLSGFTERHVLGVRYLIPMTVLVLGLAGILYWQNSPATNDIAEIDIELLTGDLPINAYLDRGFDSWLKRSSR
ncbi:MAG: DUF3619 family protein [Pseudomonadota bacterium]